MVVMKLWELESIFDCGYPHEFKTLYKHLGGRGPYISHRFPEFDATEEGEPGSTYELVLDDSAGIVKHMSCNFLLWFPTHWRLVRPWVFSHMENPMIRFLQSMVTLMVLLIGRPLIEM